MAENEVYVIGPDGKEYRTGGDTLRDYLASGYTLSKNQPNFRGVPVRLSDGTVAELDPQKAEETIRSGDANVISRDELVSEQERQIYRGGAGGVAATAAAIARGATLGLSDLAATAIDPSLASDLRRLQEENPTASTLGELGGSVASLLATGGAGGLGKLAGRGAAALGAAEGGLAAKAIAGAVTGAAEMGAISAGQELSQAALQERETSAARVAEAFGHGALLGGIVGGALPLIGGALRALPMRPGSLSEEALAYAQEKALKSTGGTQKQIGKILDASPELRQVADEILTRDAPRALGKAENAVLSRAEMKAGIEAVRKEIGEEMGAALRAIDANARGVGANIAGVVQRAREEILAPLESNVFAKAEARAVEKQIRELEKLSDFRVGFEALHELSSQLGKVIRKNPTASATEELKAFRSLLEEEITNGAARVSQEIGGDIAGQYAKARTRYAAAKMLEDAVDTGVKAEAKNLTFSLSSMLAGGAGTSVGATIGGAVAGPMGASIGSVVGGAAGAVLANLNKRFGDQVVSTALRAYAQGEPKALAGLVDTSIGQSVSKLLSSSWRETGRGATIAVREAILGPKRVANDSKTLDRKSPQGGASPRQTAALRERIVRSAEQQQRAIAAAMEGAPSGVVAALQGQLAASKRATNFLLSKIPSTGNVKHSLTPAVEAPRMTKAQLDAFVTAARVVADPLSVLDSLSRGELNRDEVDALREAAPNVYLAIRDHVQAQLAEREEPLPYKKALQLSLLLGVVGHPALAPEFVSAVQSVYAPVAGEAQPSPPVTAPKRAIRLSPWSLRNEEA